MRRMIHAAALLCALAISGCGSAVATLGAVASAGDIVTTVTEAATSSAPITEATIIDDKVFVGAKASHVLALDASIAAVDVGAITPGSPLALKIDGLLTDAGKAIDEAEVFYRGLNIPAGRSRAAVAEDLAKRAKALIDGKGL